MCDLCPKCKNPPTTGLYSRERDMTVAWVCNCGHMWERRGFEKSKCAEVAIEAYRRYKAEKVAKG